MRSNLELFDTQPSNERVADGAFLLRGFALENIAALLSEIEHIETAAAFRHLQTPGGFDGNHPLLGRQRVNLTFRRAHR